MLLYDVSVTYTGIIDVVVEAETEYEALEMAEDYAYLHTPDEAVLEEITIDGRGGHEDDNKYECEKFLVSDGENRRVGDCPKARHSGSHESNVKARCGIWRVGGGNGERQDGYC